MEKKEFKHEKKEICRLCKKEIDTDVDNWNALVDYNGQNQRAIGFAHVKCLTDLIKGSGKVITERFQNRLQKFVSSIFPSGAPQEEDFIEC